MYIVQDHYTFSETSSHDSYIVRARWTNGTCACGEIVNTDKHHADSPHMVQCEKCGNQYMVEFNNELDLTDDLREFGFEYCERVSKAWGIVIGAIRGR